MAPLKFSLPARKAGKPVTKRALWQLCCDLVADALLQESSWPFQEPVDYVGLKLTDYRDVVKCPMDLSTVQANLAKGKYAYARPPLSLYLLRLFARFSIPC